MRQNGAFIHPFRTFFLASPKYVMSFETSRADLIIQYALLLAGEADDRFSQQLGPIHLIKYVYLADLAHARRADGNSYTGATWRFHHFGPWDAAVYQRVEPAVQAIHAEQITLQSDFGEQDWIRYRLNDSQALDEIERKIPGSIALPLRQQVRKFLGDTPSLLDYVYKTQPMLHAAPAEQLDLSLACIEVCLAPGNDEAEHILRMEQLSNKKRKQFHRRIRKIHESHIAKPELMNPVKTPRYDKIYACGIAWLEELAGRPQLESSELVAEFSDDVWNSSTRNGEDVS